MRKFFAVVSLVLLLCVPVLAATPEVWYSTDGKTVWRESKEGREKTNLDPMFVEGADYHEDDDFYWVEVDSAVWVCNVKNRERMPVRILLRKGEKCWYVAVNTRWGRDPGAVRREGQETGGDAGGDGPWERRKPLLA